MVEAARLLKEAVAAIGNQEQLEQRVRAITEAEHRGDFIVHEIFDLLRSTFITPLDRDQIQQIATAIDDVVDRVEAAGDALLIYRIEWCRPEAVQLAEIVMACAEQINRAMPDLREKRRLTRVRECM